MTAQLEPGNAGCVQDAVAAASARSDLLDPVLGTFLHRSGEASSAAERLDAADERGSLHGLLIGVKDAIAVRDAPTTSQSGVYDRGWWAGRDATAVARLRSAGAVIVGKTTMAEHALSRPDPAAPYPVPRNPWDLERWPGGSSCGSANGLPAGLFDAALGTDSNGSLRIPAALCGVSAIKPTYGSAPMDGVRPLARSIDVVGPLARDIRTCSRVLSVLRGSGAAHWRRDLSGVRLGVPFDLLGQAELSEDCQRAFDAALAELRAGGAEIVSVDLPEALPMIAAGTVTLLAEAFELFQEQLRGQWERFGRPFRRSVVVGGLLDAATYLRAQRVRAWAADSVDHRLRELDAVATPTWPETAPRYADTAGLYQMSWLPGLWSAVGLPAVAVPMGFSGGLPLSLQLVGAAHSDFQLAEIADVYQSRTAWHRAEPVIPADARPAPVVLAEAEGPGDAEAVAALAASVRTIGVPVADEELPAVLAGYTGIRWLAGMLPDLPAEIGSLATVRM